MKNISIVILILLSSFTNYSQEFKKGTQVLSAGIGFGSNWGLGNGGTQTPALSVSYEQGIWDIDGPGVISLGGYIGHKSFHRNYDSPYYWSKQRLSYTMIGARSAYHFNMVEVDNLDLYAGAMLSFNIARYKFEDGFKDPNNTIAPFGFDRNGSYGSRVGLSFYGGARYFFNSQFAAFGEIGYGVSYLTLGIAYRL